MWTTGRDEPQVMNQSERVRTPTLESTDQKVGGSSPSERAQLTSPLPARQRAFLSLWEPHAHVRYRTVPDSSTPPPPAYHPPAEGSMSARCVTDWPWPQVQVAHSRRLLLHRRKRSRWVPDGDLQNIRGDS